MLKAISTRLNIWHWLPSRGRSGGILFGGDSNKMKVLSCQLHTFCLDIQLENKLDSQHWQVTVVYGPVDKSLKPAFLAELDTIRQHTNMMWVICGDFNSIRHRSEKSGVNFDVKSSRLFNAFISRHNLLEHQLRNRKFTWSSGGKFALLDRFFSTINWDAKYSASYVQDLSNMDLTIVPSSYTHPHTFIHLRHNLDLTLLG